MKKKMMYFFIIILIITGAGFVFLQFFSLHFITGTSMEPSVYKDDLVLVNEKSSIQRYALVAFNKGKDQSSLIKRVIGLPGDSYVIQGNQIILNIGSDGEFNENIQLQLTPEVAADLLAYDKIPANQFLVVGDNAKNSVDSRSFGLVTRENILGRASFRLTPFKKFGTLY